MPHNVATPVRGLIHNKGGAVDIPLVTLQGVGNWTMGTDFDFWKKGLFMIFGSSNRTKQ